MNAYSSNLRALMALALLAAVVAGSVLDCSSKRTRTTGLPTKPGAPPETIITGFPPVYPYYQSGASWSRTGLIAYRDEGITCVMSSSGYFTDASKAGIWVLDPSSGARRRLVGYGEDPSWSPDGSKLAFEYNAQIFIMDSSGTGVTQLTNWGENFYPTWHPSGRSICFDSNGGSGTLMYYPWTINPDGTGAHRLCPVMEPARNPSWRPDSSALALETWVGQGAVISALDDSCAMHVLVSGFSYCADPEYSPSGDRIAFSAYVSTTPVNIWVCNADGSGVHQVTNHGGRWPTWSPDGQSIAYTAANARDTSATQNTLHILNLSTLTDRVAVPRWPRACP